MNESDWLTEIQADLQLLAQEIKESLAVHGSVAQSVSSSLEAARLPNELFQAVPSLPRKAGLVSGLHGVTTQLDSETEALLNAVAQVEKRLTELQRSCRQASQK